MVSSRARLWFVLVPFIGAALAGIYVAATQGTERRGPGMDVARAVEGAGRASTPPLDQPAVGAEARLAPVTDARADSAAGLAAAAPNAPASHTTLPRVGSYRLIGRVLDLDEQLLTSAAEVKVYVESLVDGPAAILGEIAVDGSGYFGLDLPRVSNLGAMVQEHAQITVRLFAPGYASQEHSIDLEDADDGLLRVELRTERAGVLVRGRAVDGALQPVGDARVNYVGWSARSADIALTDSARSDADGTFVFELEGIGWVDAMCVHPSVGIGKASRRIESGEALVDLGNVFLVPRSVIAGRVLGLSGAPVPRYSLEAVPSPDIDDVPTQSTSTDAQGRFRFANLDPVKYVLSDDHIDVVEGSVPVFEPDVTDVVHRLHYPTLTVRVIDGEGRPAPVDGISWAALTAGGGEHSRSGPHCLDDSHVDVGLYHLIMSEPGRFAIGATASIGDESWSATRTVDLGREQLRVELPLERDRDVPVTLEILGPEGQPVSDWRAAVRDPASRLRVAGCTSRRRAQRLKPGHWEVRVTPGSSSLVFPFDATIDVEEPRDETAPPQVFQLRGAKVGSRLTVALVPTDAYGGSISVRLRPVEGPATRGRGSGKLGGAAIVFPTLLRAGDYEVVVERQAKRGVPAGKVTQRVSIDKGLHERLSIAFPGARSR